MKIALRDIPAKLAQADTVFFLLPPLVALLVAGTLAQRWLGLYDAQAMFFSSFYFWAGPLPLPGGYTLCGLLAAGLIVKFLFYSEWNWRRTGIIMSHLGTIILLAGGLLTALTARESYMAIPEGQSSPYIYDYIDTQLSVFIGDKTRIDIPFANLQQKKMTANLPFELEVIDACSNCAIIKREEKAGEFGEAPLRDMAQHMALVPKPRDKEAETNLSGVSMLIAGLDEDQDGAYIAFNAMPKPIELQQKNHKIRLVLGKVQRALPFAVELKDFEKTAYPGTDTARAYRSDVIVHDGAVRWPARISMNAPLRYKGYTFYQSAFEQTDQGEITILAVVENSGRVLPYLGTLVIAAGLLLHLVLAMRLRREP